MRGGVCAYGGIAVNLSRYGGGYILVNLVENKAALHRVTSSSLGNGRRVRTA